MKHLHCVRSLSRIVLLALLVSEYRPAEAIDITLLSLNAVGSITVQFGPEFDKDGNITSWDFLGWSPTVSINPLPFAVPITADPNSIALLGASWKNLGIWGGSVFLPIADSSVYVNIVCYLDLCPKPSLDPIAAYDALQTLSNTGPTERSVSVPLGKISYPGGELDFGANVTLTWSVSIPTGAHVLMDQPNVVIQTLNVDSGGGLVSGLPGNGSFTVRGQWHFLNAFFQSV